VPGFGYFHLLIDDVDVSGRVNVNGTGGWQNWTPKPVRDVYLTPGVHRLRYEFGSDSDKQGWLFSLNHTAVELQQAVSTEGGGGGSGAGSGGGGEDDIFANLRFDLLPNHPNPFNPSTSIPFSLQRGGHVHLSVHNIHGQLIETLIDGPMSRGYHTAVFTADRHASGVYLVRLRSDEGMITRSMLLVK
jgi:hypothetical protein